MGLLGDILKVTAGAAVAVVAAPVALGAAAAGTAGAVVGGVVGAAAASQVAKTGGEILVKSGAVDDIVNPNKKSEK